MKNYTIFLFIIALILIMGGVYISQRGAITPTSPAPVACTMEAKICPDGSAVGRQGPNCEFAPCPAVAPVAQVVDQTADWKTYRNEKFGFEFKYPKEWTLSLGRDQGEVISFSITASDGGDQITIAPLTTKITCATLLSSEPKGRFRCEEIKGFAYFVVYINESSSELFDKIKTTINLI